MGNNISEVTTGKVRLSYVHLFQPYTPKPGSDPKYSCTILLPKSDIATKQKIDAAINAAIQQGVSSKWGGVRPPLLAIPVHDGDGPRPSDGMPFGEECRGHWVFTASSKQRVEIIDLNLNPIIDQTQVYSGIYARVVVRFFPFNQNGKKGVGCGLYPIQKLEDGEPLGGGMSAAEAFGGGAPAYPQTGYGQPQQYAQPAYQPAPAQPAYGQPAPNQYGQPAQPYAAPAQPSYPQQQPYNPQQQPSYGQPTYAPPAAPQQPMYGQAPQPGPIDPITGKPIVGGVYGI